MTRKTISKSMRFEIFKRDKFTCQYCGASAPNVILEVDHIKPVSKGGTNDIMNLVTSCKDCNRGKTNKELSDNSTVIIQKKQLDEIQERREQLEMMLQWRDSLEDEISMGVDAISEFYRKNTRWALGDGGKVKVRALIRKFGFAEVYTACEISVDTYYKGDDRSWDNAFSKVGGICYNRRKARECNA